MGKVSPVSSALFERSKRVVPGGVNSPVRAWNAVGGEPRYVARGDGSRIVDAEGREYIDYVCAWGPLILGHAPPAVVRAVVDAVPEGMGFGAPTSRELELAELVSERMPAVEQLRLVNSGTEATMSAVRLARGYTGRSKILKFDGCYHGHVDALLAKAGSGVASLSLPDSAGVPESFTGQTLIADFNDPESAGRLIRENHEDLAAVIVEPVCGNMGVTPPEPGFLEALREETRRHGIVLIFDEVITGFRVARGGAQERYGVTPDLTCLGKILGGGLPVGAFGGRRDIMSCLAPVGPVYQAGTLSGNPVTVAAGLATLEQLEAPGVYEGLEEKGRRLQEGLEATLGEGLPGTVNRVGSMLTLFLGPDRVASPDHARGCDRDRFARFFHGMLARGVYLPPSPFEALFVSLAHEDDDIAATVAAFADWAAEETALR
ncbi:MAG: glutamate-1-semialdehyde 2,1-aminomutase [Deltaproteobacteria bacterium]|nr:glutamate-1-semialdehyde 2,1-aminomutase [Deltaproteobacteria bacterium]